MEVELEKLELENRAVEPHEGGLRRLKRERGCPTRRVSSGREEQTAGMRTSLERPVAPPGFDVPLEASQQLERRQAILWRDEHRERVEDAAELDERCEPRCLRAEPLRVML